MHALQTRGLLFIRLTEFRPCSGATHSLALPPCQAAPYPPLCSAAHLLAAHPAHTITRSIITQALPRILTMPFLCSDTVNRIPMHHTQNILSSVMH